MGFRVTYEARIDQWIAASLLRSRTLAELIPLLPGVFPTEIAAGLARLGVELPLGQSEELLRLPGPIPHPVDGDWRLHPESLTYLTGLVSAQQPRAAALLGCPSLAVGLTEVTPRVALLEGNEEWKEHLARTSIDVCWGDITRGAAKWQAQFNMSIADPPWYAEDYETFLAVAGSLLTPNGVLLCTWPAEGTRPNIGEDWGWLMRAANLAGLELVAHDELVLRYATPFYEGMALRAGSLPVLAAWRRANLLRFVRNQNAIPPQQTTLVDARWKRVRYRSLRVRCRMTDIVSRRADVRLEQLVENEILPSVSRRDLRRSLATIWTAANRIFRCARGDLVAKVIECLEQGRPARVACEDTLQRTLDEQETTWLHELIERIQILERSEAEEYRALHGGTAAI